MKRNLFLALLLVLVNVAFTQNEAYIVNETFDGETLPEGWYFTGEGSENFTISKTNNAGGNANELLFKSSPIVTAGIHLVMATADLTDVDKLGISFKHCLNYDQLSHTIGIATSSDDGTTWNTAWSQTYSKASSSGQHEINETVSTPDMGKDNVLICLFYEGNTYNFNKWYFDNINIFAKSDDTELQLSSVDIENVIPMGNTDIEFTVSNIGGTEITSFEASYEIEGYETYTESFNDTIESSSNKNFKFSKAIYLLPGSHSIKVNILSVNGENDTNLDNNTMSKDFKTYIKDLKRTPMIEHFSSATCINCVTADTTISKLTHDNEGLYTYVKYPFNYPYPGDKYYTKDCKVRSEYYGVNGVPAIFFDGTTMTKEPKQSHFNERYDIPSYMDIAGAFEVNETTINITADVISYIDMPDVRIFVSVNEKTTTGNVGPNKIPEFHHVLMAMASGNEGIDANFVAGEYQRFEFSYNMDSTNVEEMSDLEVAVWVQNYESKEIHNSSFLYEYTEHPYPVRNLQIKDKTISWEAPEEVSPIGYNVYVDNKLVAENIKELSHTIKYPKSQFVVEVIALYENKMNSVGVTMTVEYEGVVAIEDITKEISIDIYPNPANDKIFIATEVNVEEVSIYDIYGRLCCRDASNASTSTMDTFNVSVQDLENGIYFINIKTDKGNIVRRFIKN